MEVGVGTATGGTPRSRRQRWVFGVAIVVVLAIGGAAFAVWNSRGDQASKTASRLLRLAEREALTDPRRATLMRVAAHDLAPSGETRIGLMTALLDAPTAARRLRIDGARPVQATVIDKTLVVASADGTVRAYDIPSGRATGMLKLEGEPTAIAASLGRERRAAIGFDDGTVALLTIGAKGVPTVGLRLQSLDATSSPVLGISLPYGGAEAVIVHENGAVDDLSTASGAAARTAGNLRATARQLGWDPAGLRVTALEFTPPISAPGTPRAPATVVTNRGVMRVDLATLSGRELVNERSLRDHVVKSVAYQPSDDVEAVLGTNRGFSVLSASGALEHRDASPTAVAQNWGELMLASDRGTTQQVADDVINAGEAAGRVQPLAERVFTAGSEPGFVSIGSGGIVTVARSLDNPPIRAAAGRETSAVGVGRRGELLTTRDTEWGPISGGLDMVLLGRPGPDDEGERSDNRFVRSYKPPRSWSTAATDNDPTLGVVNTIAVSDRFVLTSGRDDSGVSSVFVWDRSTARPLHRLALTAGPSEVAENTRPGVTRDVMDMAGANRVVVYSTLQEAVVGWNPKTWEQEYTRDVGPIFSMAADPEGRKLVVAALTATQEGVGDDHRRSDLLIVDAASGEIDRRVPIEHLVAATYSPDGRRIAALLSDGRIQLRGADGKEVHATHHVDDAGSTAIAWSHDGTYLAVVRGDEEVILVDADSGRATPPLPSRTSATATATLAFSNDDRYLVARQLEQGDQRLKPSPAAAWRLGGLRERACALAGSDISRPEWRKWIGTAAAYRSLCRTPKPVAARPPSSKPKPATGQAPPYLAAYAVTEDDASGGAALYGLTGEAKSKRIGTLGFGGAVRWSARGAMAWTSDQQLHLLPADGGAEQVWSCGCSGVAFAGERVIAVGGTGVDLLEYESGTAAPVRTSPLRGLPRHAVRILGYDTRGRLLVGGFDAPQDRGSTQVLAVVDAAHRVTRVDHEELGQVYADSPSSPADDLLITFSVSSGACSSPSTIYRISPASGELRTLPWPKPDTQWAITDVESATGGKAAAIGTQLPKEVGCPDPPIVGGFLEDGEAMKQTDEPSISIDVPGLGRLTESLPDASASTWERTLTLDRDGPIEITDKLNSLSTP